MVEYEGGSELGTRKNDVWGGGVTYAYVLTSGLEAHFIRVVGDELTLYEVRPEICEVDLVNFLSRA